MKFSIPSLNQGLFNPKLFMVEKFMVEEFMVEMSGDGKSGLNKGQLISKRNSEAEDSPKKQTNEFVFTSMRRVFVCFLGESSDRKKLFEII